MSYRLAADAAGWVGAFALVGAYHVSSAGLVRADARSYQLLNVVGSLGLGAVACAHHTWPSVALNSLWLLIAVVALRRTVGASARPNRHPGGARRSPPRHPDLIAPTAHTDQGALS